MGYFQAVNVRLVLLPAAVTVYNRLGEEAEDRDNQQQNR